MDSDNLTNEFVIDEIEKTLDDLTRILASLKDLDPGDETDYEVLEEITETALALNFSD